MIKKKKSLKLIILILLINLIFSANLSLTLASESLGEINIDPCETNCLTMSTPEALSISSPQFIDNNQNKTLHLYTNYNLGEKVSVTNYYLDRGFKLDVSTTSLTNRNHPVSSIPYTQMGIISFNNGSESTIDASRILSSATIESLISPLTEPFDQYRLENDINNDLNIQNYYTIFAGTETNSDRIEIISNTPPNHNSAGMFEFGISIIINIPAGAINEGFTEGEYGSSLLFTLYAI